jgi:hypothetical protein
MKHWIACLSLMVALLGSGCDTVNHSQLQIRPPLSDRPTQVAVPVSDREAVRKILGDIATKYQLADRTESSFSPDVIGVYTQAESTQPVVNYPLRVVAWADGNRIVIDLEQTAGGIGESTRYRQLRDQIINDLKNQFESRLEVIHKSGHASSVRPIVP